VRETGSKLEIFYLLLFHYQHQMLHNLPAVLKLGSESKDSPCCNISPYLLFAQVDDHGDDYYEFVCGI